MARTVSQRIVDALPWLDTVAEKTQPKVQDVVEAGGTPVRNALDGTPIEIPLHPALTDVPIGSWTAALIFDGFDAATGSRTMRNAADATLVVGIVGGFAAAATGLSDWRYLRGGSRRMGVAHGLLNTVGLALNTASLGFRAAGRRNAGRLAFLLGYSISGMAAHLGGELSYAHGLRVNRNVFEPDGPDEYTRLLMRASCRSPACAGSRSTAQRFCSAGRTTAGSAPSPTYAATSEGRLPTETARATPSSVRGTNRASTCAAAR